MSHIVIDGYNLIPKIPSLTGLALEEARSKLTARLVQYKTLKPNKITVVFDGRSSLSEFATGYQEKGIHVIFSAHPQTADDVIIDLIKRETNRLIVVSSDQRILQEAERQGSAFLSSEEFYQKMQNAMFTEKPSHEGKQHPHKRWTTKKKGPKRRLPKQQRRQRQRLEKL